MFATSDSTLVMGKVVTLLVQILDNRAPARVVSASLCFMRGVNLGSRLDPAHDGNLLTVVGRVHVCTLTCGAGRTRTWVCGEMKSDPFVSRWLYMGWRQ